MDPLEQVFRRAALNDIHEASAYYAGREDDPRLVLRFLREVDKAAMKAATNPQVYREVYFDFRRVIVRRFPYHLYFRVSGSRVEMFGLVHTKRSPSFLIARLG